MQIFWCHIISLVLKYPKRFWFVGPLLFSFPFFWVVHLFPLFFCVSDILIRGGGMGTVVLVPLGGQSVCRGPSFPRVGSANFAHFGEGF